MYLYIASHSMANLGNYYIHTMFMTFGGQCRYIQLEMGRETDELLSAKKEFSNCQL